MKQSFSLRISNSTFFNNDEFMTTTITSKIWDFFKRKTDTVDLNEDSRVKIHDKTIFTSTLTYLIILQNTHLKFSITSKSMIKSISRSLNQYSNSAMNEKTIQTSCRSEHSSSYWVSRYWFFRDWVSTISNVKHRFSVQINANVSIVVSTSDNFKRFDHDRRYQWKQNR